jgi:hypothetical protein
MPDPVSFKGSSGSRSIEEAIKEALKQISDYNDNLPGADSQTTARLEAIRFTKGGFPGYNNLEVEFLVDPG